MSVAWTDLGGTTASAITNVFFSCPIPGVNAAYLLRQKFMQPIANFVELALNTAHASYTDYRLVSEENFDASMGGGMQVWDRVYAKTPDTHYQPSSLAYHFIGFGGFYVIDGRFPNGIAPNSVSGRDRFNRTVPMKCKFEYFLVGAGGSYANEYQIPINQETVYILPVSGSLPASPGEIPVDFLGDATQPTRDEYIAFMDADRGDPESFSIVAQASQPSRWMGNIFCRETRFIKAL